MSASKKGRNNIVGRPVSEETRNKIRESRKKTEEAKKSMKLLMEQISNKELTHAWSSKSDRTLHRSSWRQQRNWIPSCTWGVSKNATSSITGTEIGGNYTLTAGAISTSSTLIRRLVAGNTISFYSKGCTLNSRNETVLNGSNCIIYLLFAN